MLDDRKNGTWGNSFQVVDHLGETGDGLSLLDVVDYLDGEVATEHLTVIIEAGATLDAALAMIRKMLIVCPGGETKNEAKAFLASLKEA